MHHVSLLSTLDSFLWSHLSLPMETGSVLRRSLLWDYFGMLSFLLLAYNKIV